jgi:hypothetical protein
VGVFVAGDLLLSGVDGFGEQLGANPLLLPQLLQALADMAIEFIYERLGHAEFYLPGTALKR